MRNVYNHNQKGRHFAKSKIKKSPTLYITQCDLDLLPRRPCSLRGNSGYVIMRDGAELGRGGADVVKVGTSSFLDGIYSHAEVTLTGVGFCEEHHPGGRKVVTSGGGCPMEVIIL